MLIMFSNFLPARKSNTFYVVWHRPRKPRITLPGGLLRRYLKVMTGLIHLFRREECRNKAERPHPSVLPEEVVLFYPLLLRYVPLVSDARSSSRRHKHQIQYKRTLETRGYVRLFFSRAWHRSTWRYEEGKVSKARALPVRWLNPHNISRKERTCTHRYIRVKPACIHACPVETSEPKNRSENRESHQLRYRRAFWIKTCGGGLTARMGGERWKLLINPRYFVIAPSTPRPWEGLLQQEK